MPIRTLVVDDHPLMLEGIRRILDAQPDIQVAAIATNVEDAVRLHGESRPDVSIIDLRLGQHSGLEVVRAIRAGDRDARIVIVTMYAGSDDLVRSIEAGALAYVTKDAVPEELVDAVRTAASARPEASASAAAVVRAHGEPPALTQREQQVMRLVADGLKDKEIAVHLRISYRTAQVHMRSIMGKLQVHDRTAALAQAVRRGIVHLP
ncbi:MAG: response regulator [Vicinamibacterales bacterium]